MFAAVSICAYDNEVSSVNIFDNYKDASKFIENEAKKSSEEMKEYNADSDCFWSFCGQRADIYVNGNLDYFWSIEPVNFN